MATNCSQNKVGLPSDRVNIYVARTSSAALAIGTSILAAAPNLDLLVFRVWQQYNILLSSYMAQL
jgi:hypothetical protein